MKVKDVFLLAAILAVTLLLFNLKATGEITEQNLPIEVDTRPAPPPKELPEELYVNSKDVIPVAGELGYMFNFCEERLDQYCADARGVLMVIGEDAGNISKMIDRLEGAMQSGKKVEVKFSNSEFYGSDRKITEVKLLK